MKTLSRLGVIPPLAMMPPAYPPHSTMATLIGRLRREPLPGRRPAGPPVDEVAAASLSRSAFMPPKSSLETVPSALFSGATTPPRRSRTPYLYKA